jgi:hypothetical protein
MTQLMKKHDRRDEHDEWHNILHNPYDPFLRCSQHLSSVFGA